MIKDPAHDATELLIKHMETDIQREYTQAYREARKKFLDYMRRFRIKDDIKHKAVAEGLISQADYIAWRKDQIFNGQRWQKMCDVLGADLAHTSELAISTARGYMPEVYAVNHNYAGYLIEQGAQEDISFELYSRETVERLFAEKPKLLPDMNPNGKTARDIALGKAVRWNAQKVNSALIQGLLQGESVPNMAKRLRSVAQMDYNASVRNARTMATGAQNAGRISAAKYAKSKGVDIVNVWAAALDMRTRHEHRLLDGQRRPIDKPFEVGGEKIRFPGDPEAAPHLVYNCRCTLIPQVKGFEYDIHGADVDLSQIDGMSYEEWKRSKKVRTNPIDLPERKGNAIRNKYNAEYRNLRKAIENGGESGIIKATTKEPDFYVGENSHVLPGKYKSWIGKNRMRELLAKAKSPQAIKYIRSDFRPSSFIGDGSTAAMREFEIATGLKCGRNGGDHSKKVADLINQINKIDLSKLPESDRTMLSNMLKRLKAVQ